MERGQSLQQSVLRQLDIDVHEDESRHKPHNFHIKVLEDNRDLGDYELGNDVSCSASNM